MLFIKSILLSFWLLMEVLLYFNIDIITKVFIYGLKYISIVSLPVLFLYFTIEYTWQEVLFRKVNRVLLWVIPAITLISLVFNSKYGLVWPVINVYEYGGLELLHIEPGMVFWLHTAYSLTLITFSLFLLARRFLDSPPLYKRQSGSLLFGCLVYWLMNILYVWQAVRYLPLDPTPLSVLISLFLFYLGLFRFGAEAIVPIVRDIIVDNMRDMVLVLDDAQRIIDMNQAAKSKLKELTSKNIAPGSYIGELLNLVTKKETGQKMIKSILNQSNEEFYYEMEETPIRDKKRRQIGSLLILHDITDTQRAMNRLEYLNSYDQLTGLYNRGYFEVELERKVDAGQFPITILAADLNGLKIINDAFGHAAGDEQIRKLASVFKKVLREGDTIARTGGDEFTAILPHTSEEEAASVVERIKQACKLMGDKPVPVSVSLGHATIYSRKQDVQQVLREADAYMYKKKLLESKDIQGNIVATLIKTLEESSFERKEHGERIKYLSRLLGKVLQLKESQLDDLSLLAMLHDIGKVAIPQNILEKKGRLTWEEWEMVQRHSQIGYHIASSSGDLMPIAKAILSHHEHWDGSGYPQKLRGEEIPYLARIISVVDAYDVMTHDQPYSAALSMEEAIAEIKKGAGTQFDPTIAQVFIDLILSGQGLEEMPLP